MTNQLLAAWVLVNDAPDADVVVRGNLHALIDDFLALLIIVEVSHHVKESVDEHRRGLVFIDGLQRHAPAVHAR